MKINLRKKLFIVLFILVALAVINFAALSVYELYKFGTIIYDSNQKQEDLISDTMTRTVYDDTTESFQKYVEDDAEIIDREFWIMKQDLESLAISITDILSHPECYGQREVYEPSRSDAGKITCQLLYSANADRNDGETNVKIRRLANLQANMVDMVAQENEVHDVTIAVPEGVSLVVDRHPEDRVDENNDPLYYEIQSKPNYTGAVESKEAFFAPLDFDEHHKAYKVSCGVPVYIDKELAAFVGSSRILSDMRKKINSMSRDISEDSFICLISNTGNILYSELEEGELSHDESRKKNVLDSSNKELVAFVQKAIKSDKGSGRVNIDGKLTFFTYSDLPTVGWIMLLGVPEETMERPAAELVSQVDDINTATINKYRRMWVRTLFIMVISAVILIILSIGTSLRYSRKLVKPIIDLKNAGIRFIKREDMEFEHTEDFFGNLNLYTGDETEDLWRTMRDLEQNIRDSMYKLKNVTAQKERIETELSVAAKIQSDMLPKIFPAFPDRKEFDLFSYMKPAKEVGGDFYDFFFTDDDHLMLVIADVSGKGVPAALFMVVARTMIKNLALSGNCMGPGQILSSVNNSLCENNEEFMFVTVWLGMFTISTGKLVWANAGHEYPVICRRDSDFELIKDIHGPGLGSFEDIDFEECDTTLAPGDILFLYTDGIPEASDNNMELYGTERMLKALNDGKKEGSLKKMAEFLKKDVDGFVSGAEQFDDITMTIFKYTDDDG